jgi:hypothetical protein
MMTMRIRIGAVSALLISLAPSARAEQAEVVVVNPPEDAVNVVPVADRIPYIRTRSITGTAGDQSYVTELAFLGVPPGFRLIIDYFGVQFMVPPGQRAGLAALRSNPGTPSDVSVPLPTEYQYTFYSGVMPLGDGYQGTVPAHVAMEYDQTLAASVSRSRPSGQLVGHVTIEGHLVPLPLVPRGD